MQPSWLPCWRLPYGTLEWTGTQRRRPRRPARWACKAAACPTSAVQFTSPCLQHCRTLEWVCHSLCDRSNSHNSPGKLHFPPPDLQAFTWAVALQLFALRHAGAAAELASAAGAAGNALSAANAALAGYVRQFLAVARTAASAAESHALLQRCSATLDTAAAQEQQLAGQEQQGRAALAAVLAEAEPVAAQVLAALQECQVGQGRWPNCLPF